MATPLPQLPLEILIIIITYAAYGDIGSAAKLSRVSSWVRDVVEPILYRVVCSNLSLPATSALLQLPRIRGYVKELGLIGVTRTNIGGIRDLEKHRLPNVWNFATDSVYNLNLVETEMIQELHLLNIVAYLPLMTMRLFGLKRFHYCGRRGPRLIGSTSLSIPGLLRNTTLTYLAISVPEELNITGFISEVKDILKSCHTLQLLYIRILHSTALVIQGAEYESLEGQLAVIGDSRLVIKRVDAVANEEVLLREWEWNARKGGGFWYWAELQLAERSMMRNVPR